MNYLASKVATRFSIRQARERTLLAFGVTDLEKLSQKGRQFGVVSAYRSNLSKSENQKRHGQLMADLQKMGYKSVESMKSSWEDMDTKVTHKEKSIYVPHISFEDLHELGKKYEQDAVLYKDPSNTIGVYFKDNTAVMAFNNKGDQAVSKSTDRGEGYSKGRGLSFGLNLVDDKKFKYDGKPITDSKLKKELGIETKSEDSEEKSDDRSPKPKSETKEKSKSEPSGNRADFLDEMGDKKVSNPNPDSRKQHPQVKIKSLDWKDQKKHYDQWARQASKIEPLFSHPNKEDGVEGRVFPYSGGGYTVTLFDLDAEETLPQMRRMQDYDAACRLAKQWASGANASSLRIR